MWLSKLETMLNNMHEANQSPSPVGSLSEAILTNISYISFP